MNRHESFMQEAIELAKKGIGYTAPNPIVGAVVVKDNSIVGRGYHQVYGGPHAEVFAIDEAGEKARDATLYVTLEPCSHYGKTPPCVNKIISAGIKEVYIGVQDPFPLVNGEGIALLQNHGIKVETGILSEQCAVLNEAFFAYAKTKLPFVTAKMAITLDGKIATKTGDSKWITTEGARMFGHTLRATNTAILVGIGTVLADNPMLNCRIEGAKQPDCIVLDSLGRTPTEALIFKEQRKVIIFVSPHCTIENRQRLTSIGAHVMEAPIADVDSYDLTDKKTNSSLDIGFILKTLGALGYLSILIEGGGEVLSSFVKTKNIDKIWAFIGAYIMGGNDSINAVGGEGINKLSESLPINYKSVKLIDNNIYIEAYTIT